MSGGGGCPIRFTCTKKGPKGKDPRRRVNEEKLYGNNCGLVFKIYYLSTNTRISP